MAAIKTLQVLARELETLRILVERLGVNNIEAIQDVMGGMVTGNVETSGFAATYDDAGGKLDFNITLATLLANLLTARGQIIRRGAAAPEALAAQTVNTFIGGDGTDVGIRTAAQVKTSLGISAFAETVLDDTDAATARATLGLTAGNYTPTLTNTTNVAASTAQVTEYMRIGDIVHVFGRVVIDPTLAAGAQTILGMSLPIASNLADSGQLSGTGAMTIENQSVAIYGDSTNDRATFEFEAVGLASGTHRFIFSYLVV